MKLTSSLLMLILVGGCGSSSPPGGGGDGGGTPHNWLAGVTGSSGALMSTPDGSSFYAARSNVTVDLNAINCVNLQTGWVVGAAGTLLTTVDAGQHWIARETGSAANLRSVMFADPQVGLAVGDGGTIL